MEGRAKSRGFRRQSVPRSTGSGTPPMFRSRPIASSRGARLFVVVVGLFLYTAANPDTSAAHCGHGGEVCDECEVCINGGTDNAFCDFDDGEPCDDGDACTIEDTCSGGACDLSRPTVCDDLDACTDDSCDSTFGCEHEVIDCNDFDACTDDSCDSSSFGCEHEVIDDCFCSGSSDGCTFCRECSGVEGSCEVIDDCFCSGSSTDCFICEECSGVGGSCEVIDSCECDPFLACGACEECINGVCELEPTCVCFEDADCGDPGCFECTGNACVGIDSCACTGIDDCGDQCLECAGNACVGINSCACSGINDCGDPCMECTGNVCVGVNSCACSGINDCGDPCMECTGNVCVGVNSCACSGINDCGDPCMECTGNVCVGVNSCACTGINDCGAGECSLGDTCSSGVCSPEINVCEGADSEPPSSEGTLSGDPSGERDQQEDDESLGIAADPLYLFSGEFFTEAEDLRIPGRGLDFVWSRKYRSKFGRDTLLGTGWDWSYNIRIEQIAADRDIRLFDGHSRSDVYSRQGDGSWAATGFFRTLVKNLDDTYTLAFARGGQWNFNALDGRPAEGKISSIGDRNGNALTFAYDASGRLVTVTDTLGRDIEVTYTPGRIAAITDFAGRTVKYEYGGLPQCNPIVDAIFNPATGHFYVLLAQASWTASEAEAIALGGHLVTINDAAENAWVQATFGPLHPGDDLWLGFNDVAVEGTFEWVSGEPVTYTNWAPDCSPACAPEPNDLGGEDYGAIWRDTRGGPLLGEWLDLDNTASHVPSSAPFGVVEIADCPDVSVPGGDLMSVTTPIVIGTPNGNDFPDGKTTSYTYSEGFADERLNHNLLTITDGRRNDPRDPTFGDGPYLVNEYATTTDPLDVDFDRVVRQVSGDPGDISDFVYVPQEPTPENGQAVMKTIVNDRVGNVREHLFDAGNHQVRLTKYTGRADPDLPTSELTNRPSGPLRAGDPPFFETQYEWNPDSLLTRIVHPNGNVTERVYESDLDPSAPPRTRGNLRILRQLPGTHTPAGDQTVLEESFDYHPDFGRSSRFVTRNIDARGNETAHAYDARGNRIGTLHRIPSIIEEFEYNSFGQLITHVHPDNGSGSRRMDDFTYYTQAEDDDQEGYLKEEIADADNFALTTRYEYDLVGNVVRKTDPRGHDTQVVRNSLNQVVQVRSREVTDGSGIRYERDVAYDANDNVIRVDIQNLNEAGVLQANSHLTTTYEYEILDRVVREVREVDPGHAIVREFEYDANRNQTLIRYGEATNGNQPANELRTLYDERDLVFQRIRAPGDPDQSTMAYDYDRNENVVRTKIGLEDTPRVTTNSYDGYNRLVSATDPMGNVATRHYDENHNVVSQRMEGELVDIPVDIPGGGSNVRLAETLRLYDAMDRQIRTRGFFFDTETGARIGDGLSVTEIRYSDYSQIVAITDDNGNITALGYDTANRLATTVDAKGNTLTFVYDANSNRITETSREKSELGGPDETYQTSRQFDNLDRLVEITDNVGNTASYAYDSRYNRTRMVDSLGTLTAYRYDGINRPTSTLRVLTKDGSGSGRPVGTIATSANWDDSSRLVQRVDPNGNVTSVTYDTLDRATAVTYADGTEHTRSYDVHDNGVTAIDANGTVFQNTFDLLDRLVGTEALPGPGVSSDTTFEQRDYDGLSRLVRAEDDDSEAAFAYDSLSNVIRESLNGAITTSLYDGVGNMTRCEYPGGRVVTVSYDELNRRRNISNGVGLLASYSYVGPGRVQRRDYGNGTRSEFEYDGIANAADDFGVKRVIHTQHTLVGSGAVIDDRTYAWNPMYHKTRRADARTSGPMLTHEYGYDSAYRLSDVKVRNLSSVVRMTSYDLDSAGNRRRTAGGPNPGAYSADEMNQYERLPGSRNTYDENGNLVIADPGAGSERDLVYDVRNRMVEFTDASTGLRHSYAYDAVGRRIERITDADGVASTTRYFYDGARVVEERDGTGATVASYVYGRSLDEVLTMRRGGTDFFYHADDLLNVMAVTDEAGAVVERYEYGDYGEPVFLDPVGVERGQSAVGNPYVFTGRRFDEETGFLYYRTRYLDPTVGRFKTRDTIGIWGDPDNFGNGYTYVGNDPPSQVDPLGLGKLVCHSECPNPSFKKLQQLNFLEGIKSVQVTSFEKLQQLNSFERIKSVQVTSAVNVDPSKTYVSKLPPSELWRLWAESLPRKQRKNATLTKPPHYSPWLRKKIRWELVEREAQMSADALDRLLEPIITDLALFAVGGLGPKIGQLIAVYGLGNIIMKASETSPVLTATDLVIWTSTVAFKEFGPFGVVHSVTRRLYDLPQQGEPRKLKHKLTRRFKPVDWNVAYPWK